MRAALVAGVCLAAVSLLGHHILPGKWRSYHPGVVVLQEISAGLTAVSLMVWLVGGVAGTRYVPWVFGVSVLMALPGAGSWLRSTRIAGRWAHRRFSEHPFAYSLLAAPVLWCLPALLLPIVDSDGLRYHLALPKLFLLEGRVFLYPWDVSGAYPQAAEMFYLLGLQAHAAEAAKWMHCAVVGLGVMAALIMVGGRKCGGLVAGLAYAASPVVLAGAAAAFVDGFAVFHAVVAALLLKRRAPSGALGIALAGAAWSKWTIAPAVVGCLVFLVIDAQRGKRMRNVLIAVVPIGIVMTPLMIRNAVQLGDPFFPIATGVFGGVVPGVDPELLGSVSQRHEDIPGPLGVPWGRLVGRVEIDEIVGWHLFVGLLLLPLLIRDRRVRIAAFLIVPYLGVGLFFHPSMRLALPMIWGLAVVLGVASQRIRLLWSLVLVSMTMILLLPNTGRDARSVIGPYYRGELDRSGVVDRLVPGSAAARFTNSLQGTGRVMALDFPAPFLFDRPWIAEGLVNLPPLRLWLGGASSAEDLMRIVERHGVRWIVVTPGYGGGRPQALLPLAQDDAESRLLLEFRSRLELLYRLDGVEVWQAPSSGNHSSFAYSGSDG